MESSSPGAGAYAPSKVHGFLQQSAVELKMPSDRNQTLQAAASGAEMQALELAPPRQMPDLADIPEGLTIYAESPNGERSACNFGNLEAAQSGRGMWLKTLALLWSEQPGLVKFDADLRLNGTQFRYSLPRWTLDDAEANLEKFTRSFFSESESQIQG